MITDCSLRTMFFIVIVQQVVTIPYGRFGTTCQSHLLGSRIQKGQPISSIFKDKELPELTVMAFGVLILHGAVLLVSVTAWDL